MCVRVCDVSMCMYYIKVYKLYNICESVNVYVYVCACVIKRVCEYIIICMYRLYICVHTHIYYVYVYV